MKGLLCSGAWCILHESKATRITELQLSASDLPLSSVKQRKLFFNWQTNANNMKYLRFLYLSLLFKTSISDIYIY